MKTYAIRSALLALLVNTLFVLAISTQFPWHTEPCDTDSHCEGISDE
jgi:hypothetical protein